MEKKIMVNYKYQGLGFPVYIDQVTMKTVKGLEVADLDEEAIQKSIILELCSSPRKITGKQLRFIRTYFELSMEEFGDLVDTTKQSVSNWEKNGDQATGMDSIRETMLKLTIFRRLQDLNFTKVFDTISTKSESSTQNEVRIKLAS